MAALDDLIELPMEELAAIVALMTEPERHALFQMIEDYTADDPYLKYNGDVKRIITEEWGEVIWSKQAEILDSFKNHIRTCVVTTPGIGKSDLVSMIICAAVAAALHDPTQVRIITTAANFRLVKTIMWPYIKRVARDHHIPGWDSKYKPSRIGATEWYINDTMVADGVASADNDETSMRGIHSLGRVIVIVDEAGGISHTIGRVLNGLLTTPEDRLIVLGNPPTDQTDTWFEWLSTQEIVNTITIPYLETPNFTGEETGVCRRCGPRVATHTISKHLTSQQSISDVRAQYPDVNDPYVQAFLFARFPTGNTVKAIPMMFLDKALPVWHDELNESGEKVKVPDEEWLVKSQRKGPIKLGVDVASDGGDELVVAWRDNWHGKIVHNSSGPTNENANIVSGKIMPFITQAVELHNERGIREPVMVNVDRTGVGWGVVSNLQDWVVEQKLNAVVVGVMVGEKAQKSTKFTKKRSEVWWNMRELLQGDDTEVTFEDDRSLDKRSAVKQMNNPSYATGTDGRIQIETKDQMKKRGAKSPDRGDAMLLAFYNDNSVRRNIAAGIFPELGKRNEHHY